MTLKGLVAVSPVKCFLAVSRNVSITRCCVGVKGQGYPCVQVLARSPPGAAARAFRARPWARFRDGIAPRDALLAVADGRLSHFPVERRPLSRGVFFLSVDTGIKSSSEDRSKMRLLRRRPGMPPQVRNGKIWTCCVEARADGPSSRRTARGSRCRRLRSD